MHIVAVLGDALKSFGAAHEKAKALEAPLLLCECADELRRLPTSAVRAQFFFSAMRHFAAFSALMGLKVYYQTIDQKVWVLPVGDVDYQQEKAFNEHLKRMSATDAAAAVLERKAQYEVQMQHIWSGAVQMLPEEDGGQNSAQTQGADRPEPSDRGLDLWDSLERLAKSIVGAAVPCTLHVSTSSEYQGWSVQQQKQQQARAQQLQIQWQFLEPENWICERTAFSRWAKGRSGVRMEYWYRHVRQKHNVLLDKDGAPQGGQWNFDAQNRGSYGKKLPDIAKGYARALGSIDEKVIVDLQNAKVPISQGSVYEGARWHYQALEALAHFITHHLEHFGQYQDAMHTDAPYGFHSVLAQCINVGLIDALWVCQKVEQAYKADGCTIESAEGFVRQIIGWREYMYGLYWSDPQALQNANALGANVPLPSWFYPTHLNPNNGGQKSIPIQPLIERQSEPLWQCPTKMRCLKTVIQNSWHLGYAHHIERLMVVANFCLLSGVAPAQVQTWFGGVYMDALEWVQLPNVSAMGLFALGQNGPTSKPYAAGGAYIKKQSNYCTGCAYDPKQSVGQKACPFSTLYWDFIHRHQALLAQNPRVAMIVSSWRAKSAPDQQALLDRALWVKQNMEQL